MNNDDRLLTERAVSQRFGVSGAALRKWRVDGTGPAFYKLGRAVRYRVEDVERYLESCRRTSTAEREAKEVIL